MNKQNHHTNIPEQPSLKPPARGRRSCSVADLSLLGAIDSKIKYWQVEDIPHDLPFEVEDNPGLSIIALTREYEGETIKVEVDMFDIVSSDPCECDEEDKPDIPIVVTVSKPGKPCLEFTCTSLDDKISIDALAVISSENSDDELAYGLDKDLQKAFHEYLEIRGVKPSNTSFLRGYMINKHRREYLMWLKSIKSFLQA